MRTNLDMSALSSEVDSLMAQVQQSIPSNSKQDAPAPVAHSASAPVPAIPVAPVVAAVSAPAVPQMVIPPVPVVPAVAAPVVPAAPVVVPPAPVAPVEPPVPVVSSNEENNMNTSNATPNVVTNAVQYPQGTPEVVAVALSSGLTVHQMVNNLSKQLKEHPEIADWLKAIGKQGRLPDAMKTYGEVKKQLREKTGIKPNYQASAKANKQAAAVDQATQAAQNMGAAANMVSAMTIPIPSAPVLPAAPVAAQVQVNQQSPAATLTPGPQPLMVFRNEKTGRIFNMWTDYCAAQVGEFALRFRYFTVGENSSPNQNPIPKAYLMKSDKVLVSLSGEEFIAMLTLINEVSKSGKMAEVFNMLQKLSA